MITPGIALRHPGLFTGRPYGTGAYWEGLWGEVTGWKPEPLWRVP